MMTGWRNDSWNFSSRDKRLPALGQAAHLCDRRLVLSLW